MLPEPNTDTVADVTDRVEYMSGTPKMAHVVCPFVCGVGPIQRQPVLQDVIVVETRLKVKLRGKAPPILCVVGGLMVALSC